MFSNPTYSDLRAVGLVCEMLTWSSTKEGDGVCHGGLMIANCPYAKGTLF